MAIEENITRLLNIDCPRALISVENEAWFVETDFPARIRLTCTQSKQSYFFKRVDTDKVFQLEFVESAESSGAGNKANQNCMRQVMADVLPGLDAIFFEYFFQNFKEYSAFFLVQSTCVH